MITLPGCLGSAKTRPGDPVVVEQACPRSAGAEPLHEGLLSGLGLVALAFAVVALMETSRVL